MSEEELTGGNVYDFYRCSQCHAVITRLQELSATCKGGSGQACPCGASRYSPTNPAGEAPDLEPGAGASLSVDEAKRLFDLAMDGATDEWRRPNVRAFAWLRYRGEA